MKMDRILYEALKVLHDNQAEYVRINQLGLPHHNRDMQEALIAITLYEEREFTRETRR